MTNYRSSRGLRLDPYKSLSKQIAEMKEKDASSQSGKMNEKRVCENCKRDVAAANFSLHEAHCLRFLAVCPKCEDLVASKDMKEHLASAHQQVRCKLCHQMMQKYLLECHEAEACRERSVKCHFCELELPFHRLQPHLDACGSRTTMCWDCGRYVMHKAQEGHQLTCQGSNTLRAPAPAPVSASASAPAPAPAPTLSSPTWTMKTEDVRPKDRNLPSIERVSMKPPKKVSGSRVFASTLTSTGPQALEETYDQLVTCSWCNILLPRPTLQKHEKKCQRVASLQALRRSPRFLGKGEESMPGSPGESSWQ